MACRTDVAESESSPRWTACVVTCTRRPSGRCPAARCGAAHLSPVLHRTRDLCARTPRRRRRAPRTGSRRGRAFDRRAGGRPACSASGSPARRIELKEPALEDRVPAAVEQERRRGGARPTGPGRGSSPSRAASTTGAVAPDRTAESIAASSRTFGIRARARSMIVRVADVQREAVDGDAVDRRQAPWSCARGTALAALARARGMENSTASGRHRSKRGAVPQPRG